VAKRQPAKVNRYKQGGKGSTVLAVSLVFIVVMMIGIYYFLQWNQEVVIDNKTAATSQPVVTTPVPVQMPVSSAKAVDPAVVPKVPGPDWEQYTDDTASEPPAKKAVKPVSGKPQLAIIIDDMGTSMSEFSALSGIGVPLTFSIIPGLRQDREVAAATAAVPQLEVMIHMPMQSQEYPKRRLESNGLLLSHDDAELKVRVEDYFARVPQAKGANNHTGSAFTEDAPRMRFVLGLIKGRGLFFVDSVTTSRTVGPKIAAELKLRSSRRDVFLDNNQDDAYIRKQLAEAVARAKKNGRAIAICHPHPVTIKTLAAVLPDIQEKEGITLVVASRLVK
jgi:uncharacterized protein